jgi:hypothetical protein
MGFGYADYNGLLFETTIGYVRFLPWGSTNDVLLSGISSVAFPDI